MLRGKTMLGYLDFLFLSYSGRIGRGAFWLATLVLFVLQAAALFWLIGATRDVFTPGIDHRLSPEFTSRVLIPLGIICALFLYPTLAIYAKRWHDRDKSAWWSLISLVPLIGGLWLLVELGFLGGTYGTNQYGSD